MQDNAAVTPRIEDLTGSQKVAILLMALGEEASTEITAKMEPHEIESISLEIARMDSVDASLVEAILEEWEHTERAAFSLAEGGVEYARKILETSFGQMKADMVLKRIESQLFDQISLSHLRNADPQQLTALLRNEHPQVLALILAHLDAGQTAAVLREIDPELGGNVMFRMAQMDRVLPDVLSVVHQCLGTDLGLAFSSDGSVAGGPGKVAQVLNLISGSLEKELLEGVAREDAELSTEIRNLMFVFEDMLKLDVTAITRVLRDVETRQLAIALKVASDGLKEKLMSAMSGRARDALLEEGEFLGPVRASDVSAAQSAIVGIIRALEETGEIVVGSDDQVIE